jgi:hypothetical protein
VTHALIVAGTVRELFETDPDVPGLDVRDVSDVAGIAVGWTAGPDGYAPPDPTIPNEFLLRTLKAEAGAFITATVSLTAQLNLNAAMNVIGAKASSARSAAEQDFTETFADGCAWIQAVRARIPELLARGGVTPAGETRWPEPSQAVRDLAALY